MSPDLTEVEKELNESKRLFVETVRSYDEKAAGDGEFIVNEFLSRFQKAHADRAKIAQEQAAEATRLINEFGEVRTRFTEHVAMLNLALQQKLLSLLLRMLRLPTDVLRANMPEPDAQRDPLTQLISMRDAFAKLGDSVNAEIVAGTHDAVTVAGYVINVQSAASGLLKNREKMLVGFRKDHFDWSLRKVPKRILGEFKGEATWEISAEVAIKLAHIVAEYIPFAAVWRAGKAVYRAATPEEHKAEPGDTDLMQILLEQLRLEKDAFEGLDKMYNAAFAELDRIEIPTLK